MKRYEQTIRIRFGHCDPAGIVYHPQYFVILNQLMEDFYRDVAGVGFIEVKKYGLGFPVAGVRCDFAAPSRVGDICTARVWIERSGETSIRFAFTIHAGDELRLQCTETCVCVTEDDAGRLVKAALPASMREALLPYLAEEGMPALKLRA